MTAPVSGKTKPGFGTWALAAALCGLLLGIYDRVYALFILDPASKVAGLNSVSRTDIPPNHLHGSHSWGWHVGHFLVFMWFSLSFVTAYNKPAERRSFFRDWAVACAILLVATFGLELYARSIYR